jgi:hypothetical protein
MRGQRCANRPEHRTLTELGFASESYLPSMIVSRGKDRYYIKLEYAQ